MECCDSFGSGQGLYGGLAVKGAQVNKCKNVRDLSQFLQFCRFFLVISFFRAYNGEEFY
jgi:hypothetical protein